ncbi:MAG: penicillin acylase family protein [Candidatus Eisenbacteria bacterium]
MKRTLQGFAIAFLALLVFLGAGAAWLVRASLPPADEALALAGPPGAVGEVVVLAYDGRGVPTIQAHNEIGIAFGQGWAHARDRRFQMELYRRTALGRLAEWVGPALLPSDRQFRVFGFAAVADSAVARLAPERRALLDAYAAGVNAYDAGHRPAPEFLIFGVPAPWRARDVVLTTMLMLQDLTWDQADEERITERMDAALPRSLVAFLRPVTTPFDVPLAPGAPPPMPPTPTPAEFDIRTRAALAPAAPQGGAADDGRLAVILDRHDKGSNNWAIAGARTASGRALVAGDPHLSLRVPVIWHRQRLEAPGLSVTGITLPGVPGVVFGSNGRVAWTGTNVEGDFVDLVRCVPLASDSTRYAGPAGPERVGERREVIAVRGAKAETLLVRTTRFGPVIAASARGGWLAAQWTALDPAMYDTDLFGLDRAGSTRAFVAALRGYGGPPLNFVAGDTSGTIAWQVGGRVPRRSGYDPGRPRDAADGAAAWWGGEPADSTLGSFAPSSGFVATSNQRTTGGAAWAGLAGMPAMPWRAHRVATVLAARAGWTADECAQLQNDVDDALLDATAEALVRALTPEAVRGDSTLEDARRLLAAWDHRADTTSVAHAYLRYARGELTRLLVRPLIAPCVAADSLFEYDWALSDEVARRLLTERPLHLLDPRYADYDALVRDAAWSAARLVRARAPGVPLSRISWGLVNRADIAHPLGQAVPVLAHWLNMPRVALAGGSHCVRVARPRSGASMRMVVDLADPARSTFALPGGQSGHFLSPSYADEYADWVAGRTTPLEPGPSLHRVKLTLR